MNINVFAAVLPWLAILACPLMMVLMMRGMSGGQCHTKARNGSQRDIANTATGAHVDDEIQELRARLARLELARHELTSRAEVGA